MEEDIESIYLGENEYSLMIPKNFSLPDTEKVDLSSMQNHTLIFNESSHELDLFLKQFHLDFKNVIKVDTIGTAVRLVKKRLGIAIMPELYARNHTDEEVKSIDMIHELYGIDLYLS